MLSRTKRLKVLVIAEAANPEWVSVPLVGWSLAHALREVADVHLVTQVRNREAIARKGLVEGTDFTAIDTEALARPMWKLTEVLRMGQGKGWTMAAAVNAIISYPHFERLVWKQFGDALRKGHYDIVHRITPLTPTTPSPLARLCVKHDVPFIMGPLNGGLPWPNGFDTERRQEREWLSYVRGAYKILPARRSTLNAATAILTGSEYTRSEIPSEHQSKCTYVPENAVDLSRFTKTAHQTGEIPLRACFIGRLVPCKGPDMLLEAAQKLLLDGRLRIDYIGDGQMKEGLIASAKELGVSDAVTFHGWVDHKDVQEIASQCQLMTFPSIKDFGGGVVLEAMAMGLVPVIVDYGGPGELVVEGVGYAVPIGTREEIVKSFRAKLEEIVDKPQTLPKIARAAQNYVRDHFTWSAKANQIANVYEWALGYRDRKPVPFPVKVA